MIQSDFLLREIRKLSMMIARLLGLSTEQYPDVALDELDKAGKLYLGLQWDMINLLAHDQLSKIFDESDNSMLQYIAVRLLEAKGDLLVKSGSRNDAILVYRKAILLAARNSPVELPPDEPSYSDLDNRLNVKLKELEQ